ncbi:hypothetical protein HPP92_000070 [Vanilla planifolia]|uniref:Uncharacterized protein n=1 Tax=Vanilla planifolia TaxID=51239 RepID=A0A835S9Y8_VANPL|nr:hypothetical protein HPP92_000070 [Vanilla planifolia]
MFEEVKFFTRWLHNVNNVDLMRNLVVDVRKTSLSIGGRGTDIDDDDDDEEEEVK